jgi:hypothetical protein
MVGTEMDALRERNFAILAATPGAFARMLGVPFVHASHAGAFEGLTPGAEDVPYRSRWLGEAQIVDGRGEVLARRDHREGEGVVVAEVRMGRVPQPPDAIPEEFWVPDLPELMLDFWEHLNEHGREYYGRVTRPQRLAMRDLPKNAG